MDHADSDTTTAAWLRTRRQLHGIAECLVAGAEYEATGEIALRVRQAGSARPRARNAPRGLDLASGGSRCQQQGRSATSLAGWV